MMEIAKMKTRKCMEVVVIVMVEGETYKCTENIVVMTISGVVLEHVWRKW